MAYNKNAKLIAFPPDLLGALLRRARRQSMTTGERVNLSVTVRECCRVALAVWMREEVEIDWPALHDALGCRGCMYADVPNLGIGTACQYLGKLTHDPDSGRCETRRKTDLCDAYEVADIVEPA